jgi:hypothetical protein
MEQKTLIKFCLGMIILTAVTAGFNFLALRQSTKAAVVYANHKMLAAKIEEDRMAVEDVNNDVAYIKSGLVEIQGRVKARDEKIQASLDCLKKMDTKLDVIIKNTNK